MSCLVKDLFAWSGEPIALLTRSLQYNFWIRIRFGDLEGGAIMLSSSTSEYNVTAPSSKTPLLAPISLLCSSRATTVDLGVQVTVS